MNMYRSVVESLEKRALFSVSLDSAGLLGVAGTSASDTLSFARDGSQVRVTLNGLTSSFDAASIAAIETDLGSGNDTATIDPRVIDVDTTVNMGTGTDTLTVLGGPLSGELTLIGDSADTLAVTLDGVTDIIRLGDGMIVREGAFSLDPALIYSGFANLNIIGSTQQDEIIIETVVPGMTLNIDTGEGNDVIRIGDGDNNVVASIGSLVNLHLGGGSDEVNFDDSAATQSISYYFNYDFDDQSRVYYYAERNDSQQVRLFGAETLRVHTSDAHDDTFTIDEQFAWGAMYIESGESAGDADRIEVNFVNEDGMQVLLSDTDPVLGNRRTYGFWADQSITFVGFDTLDWATVYYGVVAVDTDGNGLFDSLKDKALPGVTVYADLNTNGVFDQGEPYQITERHGDFRFIGHNITSIGIVPPAGYSQLTPYNAIGSTTPLGLPVTPTPGSAQFMSSKPFFLTDVPSTSQVTGRLFGDLDRDGFNDATDTGLSAVSISLDLNANGIVDANEPTTLTDSAGRFAFANVPQGPYAVIVPDSLGGLAVYNRVNAQSSLLRYNENAEVSIAYAAPRLPGDISGFVYVPLWRGETGRSVHSSGVEGIVVFMDANRNGTRDQGEFWTTTDAGGAFYFSDPGVDTHRIAIELTDRYPMPLATDVPWQDVSVTPTVHFGNVTFRLADLERNGYVRTLVRAVSPTGGHTAGTSGFIYIDLNHDNQFSPDEPRTVYGGAIDGLAHGTYRVNYSGPSLYRPRAGFENGMLLEVGATPLNPLFEIEQRTGPLDITVHILEDVDHDGGLGNDTRELGFPVFIDLDGNGVRSEMEPLAKTNWDGTRVFEDFPDGTYTFVVQPPAGWIGTGPENGSWTWQYALTHNPSIPTHIYFRGYEPTPTPSGSIAGVVYFDADKDGLRDSGEAGIGGRTVWLDEDNDKIVDEFERVTTTASDGSYVFDNLPDGIYKVRQIVPLGWQQTYPSNGYGVNVNVVGGQPAIAKPHGVFSATGPGGSATAAGWMFFDNDKDGIEDPGETRQSGKIVYVDANNNGKRDSGERQVTTNAQGEWSFTNLSPGTYVIRREVPSGYYVSTPVIQIALASDQVAAGLKIGTAQGTAPTTPPVTPPPPTDPTDPVDPVDPPPPGAVGSISGYLFWDANANTIEDTSETRQGGKVVYLDLNNNGKMDSAEPSVTTNANGEFAFSDLDPRTYVVRRTIGRGYWVTTPLIQIDLSGQTITNQKIGTAPGSGTQPPPVTDPTPPTDPVDPPPVVPPPVGSKGSISGFLFNDTDGDGIVDSNEGRASGRVVYIDANNNGKLDAGEKQTSTNTQGIYTFTGLDAGLYRVRRVFPNGYRQSTGVLDINLAAGQVIDSALIGSTARALIAGNVTNTGTSTGIASRRVFVDGNGNGKYDAGEKNVFTDSSGAFEFFDLVAGTYKIRADVPSGWTTTNAALATISVKAAAIHTTTVFGQSLIN